MKKVAKSTNQFNELVKEGYQFNGKIDKNGNPVLILKH